MASDAFHDFVKSQHVDTRVPNWIEERDQWLRNLNSLYKSVESFLAEYVAKGEIRLKYRQVTLNEEELGRYKAKQMIITIGRKKIELEPIGRFVLRAYGRADIVGSHGRNQLLLVDKSARSTRSLADASPKNSLTWKWATPPPERKLKDLTKELFYRLLMEVVNGQVNGR
jgi:hypothetical protein